VTGPDVRIAYEISPGLVIYAMACRCGSCKNFFMVPKTEFGDDDPRFCCHCGHAIQVIERGDLSEEMAVLFDTE